MPKQFAVAPVPGRLDSRGHGRIALRPEPERATQFDLALCGCQMVIVVIAACLVVASCLAIPTYYGMYHTIRVYRMRRWGQMTPP